MRKQDTQRGESVELANSVKALKLAILQAQHAVAADGNRVMLMLLSGHWPFRFSKNAERRMGNRGN